MNRAPGPDEITDSDRRVFAAIRIIASQPRLTQRQLAASLGVSLGKANFCVRALVARGLVKAENYRRSDNKRAYFYLLTPSGLATKAELTRRFLAQKLREYDTLRAEIEALRTEDDNSLGLADAGADLEAPRLSGRA